MSHIYLKCLLSPRRTKRVGIFYLNYTKPPVRKKHLWWKHMPRDKTNISNKMYFCLYHFHKYACNLINPFQLGNDSRTRNATPKDFLCIRNVQAVSRAPKMCDQKDGECLIAPRIAWNQGYNLFLRARCRWRRVAASLNVFHVYMRGGDDKKRFSVASACV